MKKSTLILFLTFFIIILAAPIVIAETTISSGILDAFKILGTFLFKDLPGLGEYGLKFLLWFALFALMNMGLKQIPHFDEKTSGIVSFVLSLMSVLLIPAKTVEGLFREYALVITFGLGVFVPVLVIWLIHKGIPADTTAGRILRGLAYLIMAYALFTFTNYVKLTVSGALV